MVNWSSNDPQPVYDPPLRDKYAKVLERIYALDNEVKRLQPVLKGLQAYIQLTDVCPLCDSWRAAEGNHNDGCPMLEAEP